MDSKIQKTLFLIVTCHQLSTLPLYFHGTLFKKTFANIFLIGFRIFGLSHDFFCRAAIFSILAGFNGK